MNTYLLDFEWIREAIENYLCMRIDFISMAKILAVVHFYDIHNILVTIKFYYGKGIVNQQTSIFVGIKQIMLETLPLDNLPLAQSSVSLSLVPSFGEHSSIGMSRRFFHNYLSYDDESLNFLHSVDTTEFGTHRGNIEIGRNCN